MWKGKARNIVPGDNGGENAQVEQNRAVAMGIRMGLGKRCLSKIEVVCSGKQYKQLFKNEMPIC